MADFDEKRREQLDVLLQQVLDLPDHKQQAFLNQVTTREPGLYNDLKKLLHYARESDSFFGETLSDFLLPLLTLLEGEESITDFTYEEDTLIGNYRIKKLIGKGGMGQVYLAERSDGVFKKDVALKCIKKGMDSEEILKRSRYERQILASLQHPNIAQLLDGGLTHDGRPFLVMEYVEGKPVNSYCDEKKLTVDERFRLFLTVCEAVQYAHQKLVIHRDLKPSNILVTSDGEVKLLDFGIAKLLDIDNSAITLTTIGQRFMTPDYAAPEQFFGQNVNTSTDVFSLGVILYEILTGHKPNRFNRFDSLFPDKDLFGKEPDRPSVIVLKEKTINNRHETESTVTANENCRIRGGSPDKISRRLNGEADLVILKALKKDPDARYQSVKDFLDDIRRHLDGHPVSAKPDSTGYRIRKFIGRHPTGVSFAAVVALLIIVFTVGITVQAGVIATERDTATAARDRAEEITNLMVNLFNASDPMAPQKIDSLSVREFLDYSLSSIRTDFSGQPELKARLLNVMGKVYTNLGLYDVADETIREGLVLREEIFGLEHPEVAESQTNLGILQWERGLYENSLELHLQALLTRKKQVSVESSLLGQNYHNLSMAHQRLDNLVISDSLAQIAVRYFQNSSRDSNADEARALENLALIRYKMGRYDEAIEILRTVETKIQNLYGRDHFQYADILANQGVIIMETGQYEEAHEIFSDALDIQRRLMGEEHSRTAFFLHNMGWALKELEEFDESEDYYRRALVSKLQHLGRHHPSTLLTQSNLAVLLWSQGNLDGAIPILEDVLTARRQLFSDDHSDVVISLYNLGAIHNQKGDFITAGTYLEEVHEIAERTLSDGHVVLSYVNSEYGAYLTETGQLENAEHYLLRSLSAFLEIRDQDDEMVQKTVERLINLYEKWDKPEEVEKYRLASHEIGEYLPGD